MVSDEGRMLSLVNQDPYMLTVVYNPWNPHKNYFQWENWNQANGYNVTSMLARLATQYISDIDDETQVELAMDLAVEQILRTDYQGIYSKIYEDDKTPMVERNINEIDKTE